jgi:hypothetical protein
VDELLVDVFLEAHPVAPEEIVLDIDTTDLALHGNQEGRFYHGHYGHYCYLPLYFFCGDHVLCARLRPSSIGPAVGSKKEVERIVQQIRVRWPEVRIIVRGDSGFCADELMTWCEQNRVGYVLGMARNRRLERLIAGSLLEAKQQFESTQQPARVFVEFEHETLSGSWSQKRRVVAKAEHIDGKSNPRFIVTSLDAQSWEKQKLYEELYCARGDMENRIKEQFVLFADRVSASTMRANQLRILSVRHRLHPDERATPVGASGDCVGDGASGHHPAAAPQNRSLGSRHGSQGVGPDGQQLSPQALFAQVVQQLRQ